MMNLKPYILPALLLACAIPAGAVRAKKDPRIVTQPDGTQLTVRLVGDERAHYLLTTDGCPVKEENGAYYFADINENGETVSTKVIAADPSVRNAAQIKAAVRLDESRLNSALSSRSLRSPKKLKAPGVAKASSTLPQAGLGRFTCNFPAQGDIKALVILVEYKDIKFTLKDPYNYFNDMLNKDGFSQYGGTGCAAEYFRLQSDNKFRPKFDVYGPVTLANNRAYYGGNNANDEDKAPEMMVVEAIKALDKDVTFSDYDMDKDGYVDNVFVFYAGQGEASGGPANSVWPHAWELSSAGQNLKVDGVTVDSYGCTNEYMDNRPDGVGTFIHEFSHVIGLPDLYDVYYTHTCTPDAWSVLDYGPYNNDGCTPPNYSAYELNAMGWLTPEPITEAENVTLGNLGDTRKFRMIATEKSNEFFLLENRQLKGWDKYLPGHGMLVWHIDYNRNVFDNNEVNTNKNHMYVRLVKASNVESHDEKVSVLQGWSWPGTTNKTSLTSSTKPALQSWAKKAIDLPITDIEESNGMISFLVDGGIPAIAAPVATQPKEVGSSWFVATWNAVDGAEDYLLTVKEKEEGTGTETYTCNMGSGKSLNLTDGWKSSSTDVYSTSGNYGLSSPSYKMGSNGVWLKTPDFASDITAVSFWSKGQNSDGSTLTITGTLADGKSVTIDEFTPQNNKGDITTINDIPSGVRSLTFTYNKVKGNLALDDVEVKVGGATIRILDGFDGVSTGVALSKHVGGLDINKTYSYSVVAVSGNDKSRPSNEINVALIESTGVGSVVSASAVSLSGRVLTSEAPVSIYDLSGSCLASGVTAFDFNAPGVYIIRLGESAHKLLVK